MWFEVKVKRLNEESAKVSESYLVEAESFADAEGRVAKLGITTDTADVDAVKKVKVNEIFHGEGIWHLAKVGLVTIDEKSGAEKTTAISCYTCAAGFDEAVANVKENMRGTISDWRMLSMSETNIVDVYGLE